MKMVKSLLLGSAAGVVAVAGAQAADLPVKAKAVEYVKICSLYGAGFYYIPGTDICMKVGGYVRFQEAYANGGANTSNGGGWSGTGGRNDRTDSQDWIMRTRAVATFDTRQQTQYGVLRTYMLMGFNQDSTVAASTAPAVYITRGFIQVAGFTFGKATSYYDFVPAAALAYWAGAFAVPDSGDGGQMLAAYTANFGGGVSASIAAEQSQRNSTVNTALGAFALGAAPTSSNLGAAGTTAITGNVDVVANLRWDGTWGAFQVAGALHDASAGYYGTIAGGTVWAGHPSNKWGWAVSPGLRLNAPMIGAGDYLVVGYSYSVGAANRGARANQFNQLNWNGQQLGFGFNTDGVYGASPGSVELTTAWSITAAYEHFWTPALQTSVYYNYAKFTHNDTAKGLICANASYTAFNNAVAATVAGGCNPDWSFWNVGSRTQWNVLRGLYVGVDVIYSKLKTATINAAGTIVVPASGSQNAGTYNVADQSAWAFAFRVHRDVVP